MVFHQGVDEISVMFVIATSKGLCIHELGVFNGYAVVYFVDHNICLCVRYDQQRILINEQSLSVFMVFQVQIQI